MTRFITPARRRQHLLSQAIQKSRKRYRRPLQAERRRRLTVVLEKSQKEDLGLARARFIAALKGDTAHALLYYETLFEFLSLGKDRK